MAKHIPKKSTLPKELQRKIEALEGETNEEKIKQMKKLMKKEAEICGALKGNGTVCVNTPWVREDGSTAGRCAIHGGKGYKAKTPEGRAKQLANLNPKAGLIHGMYSQEFKEKFTTEEVEFYNETVNWFVETHPENVDPVNMSLLHGFAVNQIKTMRQESTDFMRESKSQNSFQRMMLNFSSELGLNKKYQDSKGNKNNTQQVDLAVLFADEPE